MELLLVSPQQLNTLSSHDGSDEQCIGEFLKDSGAPCQLPASKSKEALGEISLSREPSLRHANIARCFVLSQGSAGILLTNEMLNNIIVRRISNVSKHPWLISTAT